MNHWTWAVSLIGILSTAVVCGTDPASWHPRHLRLKYR